MGHRNLAEAVADLERAGQLVRVEFPIDPHLELAEVQRRLYRAGGPVVLFTRPKGTAFPMLANLFGTPERLRFLFRDALAGVRKLVELKTDPGKAARRPWRYRDVPGVLWRMRPRFVRSGPVLAHRTTVSNLPQLKCWPADGGAFVTLPQVYTEDPDRPGWRHSNLGMYRVQLSGNEYEPDREVGLHYQIHRGIGPHHAAALRRGEPLRVNVVVGGPPALPVAAVMPLPEGLPELAFAGALGGRRLRMIAPQSPPAAAGGLSALPFPAEADFVIAGTIDPTRTKPEGPFGDHLGYYSLKHDFPVMRVEAVYHRPGAIWPFTVVGRPPQEDTSFGEFIHELTGPVIPTVVPGLHAVHAVDAAGVHPLLLAIGSERYVPYAAERRPQELLTLANAILGQGQLSLAKYLFIVAREDAPDLDAHDIRGFFRHVLERADWGSDLHFQTRTTIDTLDYSAGEGLNAGSKLVVAVAGPKRRELETQVPEVRLPDGFADVRVALPGVLVVRGPKYAVRSTQYAGPGPGYAVPGTREPGPEPGTPGPQSEPGSREVGSDPDGQEPGPEYHPDLVRLTDALSTAYSVLGTFPLLVVVDDSDFAARSLDNFLWVTFTRSNPAADVLGVRPFTRRKHWGCLGPLVIDARLKPHMAPPLEEDPAVTRRVDELAARGGPLHGLIG